MYHVLGYAIVSPWLLCYAVHCLCIKFHRKNNNYQRYVAHSQM